MGAGFGGERLFVMNEFTVDRAEIIEVPVSAAAIASSARTFNFSQNATLVNKPVKGISIVNSAEAVTSYNGVNLAASNDLASSYLTLWCRDPRTGHYGQYVKDYPLALLNTNVNMVTGVVGAGIVGDPYYGVNPLLELDNLIVDWTKSFIRFAGDAYSGSTTFAYQLIVHYS